MNDVIINGVSYPIFYYEAENDSTNNNVLSKLYTCINCEFAAWTQDKLFELIETYHPLLFSSKFKDLQNDLFEINHNEYMRILDVVKEFTERFINILFDFISKYLSYNSLIDTGILKSLISLHFKIDFIKTILHKSDHTNKDDKLSTTNGSDVIEIRGILEVINDIQSFMMFNCEIFPLTYDNKQLFGYLMSKSVQRKDKICYIF